MAGGYPYGPDEDEAIRTLPLEQVLAMGPARGWPPRTLQALTKRRSNLGMAARMGGPSPVAPQSHRDPHVEARGGVDESVPQFSVPPRSENKAPRYSQNARPIEVTPIDKKHNALGWRDHLRFTETVREYRDKGSRSQDRGAVQIHTDRPVCVLVLSDTHIGSVGADVEAFTRITEEILTIPDLYVILAGDLLNLAIQVKHGIGSMLEDVLTPGQQFDFLEDWLDEIQHKILAATWDNHVEERESRAVGTSSYARMLGQRCIYHSGIGHLSIHVNEQTYEWAVTHRFRYRSELNPVHGQMKYIRMQAPHIEIAAAGDSHVPGYAWFTHGGERKWALNAGSLHTGSRYARRYFSLTTATDYPCVALWPNEHRAVVFPSVADWLATR